MKVSHGSGAKGCEIMAMETVTMGVMEEVVPSRQTTRRGDRRPHAADPDADAGKDSGDAQPKDREMPRSCAPGDGAGYRKRGRAREGNLAVRR